MREYADTGKMLKDRHDNILASYFSKWKGGSVDVVYESKWNGCCADDKITHCEVEDEPVGRCLHFFPFHDDGGDRQIAKKTDEA